MGCWLLNKTILEFLLNCLRELYQHVRSLDSSRPITFVNSEQIQNAKAVRSSLNI